MYVMLFTQLFLISSVPRHAINNDRSFSMPPKLSLISLAQKNSKIEIIFHAISFWIIFFENIPLDLLYIFMLCSSTIMQSLFNQQIALRILYKIVRLLIKSGTVCASVVGRYNNRLLRCEDIQQPEKYKQNFDVFSEYPSSTR
jgi:hypothetical protein